MPLMALLCLKFQIMSQIKTYIISNKDYLNSVFDILPSNAFIDKGRCGIGGTTLELEAHRHSIIIVPTNGIIKNKILGEMDSKEKKDPLIRNIFGIYKGVTSVAVEQELTSNGQFIKIMVTPDSFKKIITAATKLNQLERLFNECFVLLDECHTSVTERFRGAILDPYKYIWKFKNKSFISATPFYFSDKRFQQLDHYRIRFKESSLGTIGIIDTPTIKSCVNHLLNNLSMFQGNLHILYNSVTEIVEAIKLAQLNDCNVHFADNDKNKETMDEYISFYKPEPKNGEYKKINFYTSKYFEGIDIYDEDATVVLVTDVHRPHTKVGIRNKGVQAIGRLRKPPQRILHVTNRRNYRGMKTIPQFDSDYRFHANKLIHNYNSYIKDCLEKGIEPQKEEIEDIQKFADLNSKKIAFLNDMKIDQLVNEDFCNEEFNHIEFIKYAWQEAGFEITTQYFEERIETSASQQRRKSKVTKMKECIEQIDQLEKDKVENIFNFSAIALQSIKVKHKLAYDAYYELGINRIEDLGYNERKIINELIIVRNKNAEVQLKKLLINNFQVEEKYTKSEVKQKLQELYDKIGIKRIATATQLGEDGRFEINEAKKFVIDKWENAYFIVRMSAELRLYSLNQNY